MGKTVEDICNLLVSKSFNNADFKPKLPKRKTLSSSVEYMDSTDILNGFTSVYKSNESDFKVQKIAKELAFAIDRNSVEKIKNLKIKYGNQKEFIKAKTLLNNKCKEVWNVYEPIDKMPKEAMKSLGITNQPDLDFLLENTIKIYEKDGGNTTAYTISGILKNENMSYTIDDIHKYLADKHLKEKIEYNAQTLTYLIKEHKYNKQKLQQLGANDKIISQILKNLSLKERLTYVFALK
jgi:hypothetical protein